MFKTLSSVSFHFQNHILSPSPLQTKTRIQRFGLCALLLLICTLFNYTVFDFISGSTLFAASEEEGRAVVLVQFSPESPLAERLHILQMVDAELVGWISPIHVAQIRLPSVALDLLASHQGVRFVEHDFFHVQGTYMPNDPDLYDSSKTYTMDLLNLESAWDVATGNESVRIAVLDTGIHRQHVEFAGRVLPGYDFINDDDDPADDHGHGTHVAGTIAAAMDNEEGGAGLCAGCSLLPVKVLDENNLGAWSTVAEGLIYAADEGADIINLSLGGPQHSQTLAEAIAYVQEQGVLVVAASGNAGGSDPFYPAALDDVLAVGATNRDDELWYLSNTGSYIDVVAPGYMIYSTSLEGDNPNEGYSYMTGTSMAAPHVAGLAGLLLSHDLTLSAADLYRAIVDTALDLGQPGWDAQFGFGRIDAGAALGGEPETPPGTIPPPPGPDEGENDPNEDENPDDGTDDETENPDQDETDEPDNGPDNDGSGALPGNSVRLYVPIVIRE